MLPKLTPEQWAELHAQSFVATPQCWLSCRGGSCCNMNLVDDIAFNMLPTSGTTLIFMGDEYDYFKSRIEDMDLPAKEMRMDFGEDEDLRIVTAHCGLNGSCSESFPKPLLCKMYPFVPIVGLDGSLEGILSGSIYDWTYEAKGWTSFCPSMENNAFFLDQWTRLLNEIDILSHPYIIFHSQAIKVLYTDYVEHLRADKRLMELEGGRFWKSWELAYLTGKLFSMDSVKAKIKAVYRKIVHKETGAAGE
ncbi:hypothetical protein DND132_0193 [Pseudodesulfovibrio mercurii]|uniref:Uncharacterized protein n=1 Tax=Pseudodesulfovibrio mercurii TaxID=641491 RepID=F0JDX1_9BACT|nr:hypothetical protein [Pseudodesulfovibrio mercurii]EGB13411.1 hypothetical protein DND132_0193 [Pseudodesulfovibrio mercurii]